MDYSTFQSPFTWRYGSDAMRRIWSEEEKRRIWRGVWVALAEAQSDSGLVTQDQLRDLKAHQNEINVPRALEIEDAIRHDLVAELRAYAELCPVGGRALHLGATSMDIEDNADSLRLRLALDIVLSRLRPVLGALAKKCETYASLGVIAFTHLQPAEPTTLGYRLATYGQDLLADYKDLLALRNAIRGKGFKGAVGTRASYIELGLDPAAMEARAMKILGIDAFPITNQVCPRRQDLLVINALSVLAATVYRFAFDLRILQSPPIGECAEPFAANQVGSSAMPFKRNPMLSERVDSIARVIAAMPRVAWDNAAHSLLERTLDDSANRRVILPETFLATDDILISLQKLVEGLVVDKDAIARNMKKYAPFAGVEKILMALVRAGANREAMHERLRRHSLDAWKSVSAGAENPLASIIANDPEITRHLAADSIPALLDAEHHIGDAPARTLQMAAGMMSVIA